MSSINPPSLHRCERHRRYFPTLARERVSKTKADAAAPEPGVIPGIDAERPRILVVDADAALFGLLREWLPTARYTLTPAREGHQGRCIAYDLIIVDVPFLRQGGPNATQRIALEHPGVPVIVLSASLFAGVERSGVVARNMGVAAVLPKPVPREALVAAVEHVLGWSR